MNRPTRPWDAVLLDDQGRMHRSLHRIRTLTAHTTHLVVKMNTQGGGSIVLMEENGTLYTIEDPSLLKVLKDGVQGSIPEDQKGFVTAILGGFGTLAIYTWIRKAISQNGQRAALAPNTSGKIAIIMRTEKGELITLTRDQVLQRTKEQIAECEQQCRKPQTAAVLSNWIKNAATEAADRARDKQKGMPDPALAGGQKAKQ